jgi:hypothetical protein
VSRNTIVIVAILIVLLLVPFANFLLRRGNAGAARVGVTTPLHQAASVGDGEKVMQLLNGGGNPKAVDENGRTPLHLSAEHGHMDTSRMLLQGGADANAKDIHGLRAIDYAVAGNHNGTADIIQPFTKVQLALPDAAASPKGSPVSNDRSQRLNPELRYPDLPSFEAAIGQPACLLKSEHVYLFASKAREEAATIVLPYLARAYDVLYGIVGVHTEYIIVVYNFPRGHKDAFGGTSNCTLWYDDDNLDLARHEEWTQYGIPHVAGYIEEMAHNFVAATRAQFGWEMIGWTIGTAATEAVAGTPILTRAVQSTREGQANTFQRYLALGYTFPFDIEPNQVDRIHAYILWQGEQQYGASFWRDFFAEVRKESQALTNARDDRDRRYQITVDCFDRLKGLNFKQWLTQNQISLVRDVKSLKPTEPGWNHKLQ